MTDSYEHELEKYYAIKKDNEAYHSRVSELEQQLHQTALTDTHEDTLRA